MINKYLKTEPTYETTLEILEYLSNEYNFIEIIEIGKTILGKKIKALKIGNLKTPTLFAATTHASEWLTTLLLIKFIDDISKSYKNQIPFSDNINIKNEFINNGLILIPIVNPDGLDIVTKGLDKPDYLKFKIDNIMNSSNKIWQSNSNGVDINHNFDAGFEDLKKLEIKNNIIGPSKSQFGGYFPNSENETKSLIKICETYNIKRLLTFHSQGEEIYYKYANDTPYSSLILARLFSEITGYKLIENDGLASHGGFKDWFIKTFKKPAFTIEIGKGKNPLPISQLENIYENLKYMLILSIIL